MASAALVDQLDDAIEILLANSHAQPRTDLGIDDLVDLAADLRWLPNPNFKAQLKVDLLGQAWLKSRAEPRLVPPRKPILIAQSVAETCTGMPTLFQERTGAYPMRGTSLLASFLAHATAAAIVMASGVWVAQHRETVRHEFVTLIEPGPYVLPASPRKAGGGGGGGDRDVLSASKGGLPRFASEQITPAAVIVRNDQPKVTADPTVVGPPELKLSPSLNNGDPLATLLSPPSNGTGAGGGIGSGTGGGIGAGRGPGVGAGYGGGIGGGVYRVGAGVSAPRPVYDPDPEYSEEARKARYQGSVVLWAIVGADGRPRNLRVQRSLGMGLDEKALEAVNKWRFEPALRDGQPVAVQINIEVSFRLY